MAVCVARLHPWKGQDLLIEALGLLKREGLLPEDFQWLLVGGAAAGNEHLTEAIARQIDHEDLTGIVKFAGETDDVRPWLWAADLSVVPSTSPDPLPTTVLESMAAGLPVVATRHGGSLDMLDHGRTGLLVDWREPREMADAIGSLVRDGRLRVSLGKAARAAVAEDFSYQRYSERWQEVLAGVLSDDEPHRHRFSAGEVFRTLAGGLGGRSER